MPSSRLAGGERLSYVSGPRPGSAELSRAPAVLRSRPASGGTIDSPSAVRPR